MNKRVKRLPTWLYICVFYGVVKVKRSRYRPGVAQRVGRGIALLFHDRDTRRGWVVSSTPRPHLPPGKTRYPFYRRLGGSQGRSGRTENIVPTRIRSRTVQSVISCYTDWTTRPTFYGGVYCVMNVLFPEEKEIYWLDDTLLRFSRIKFHLFSLF